MSAEESERSQENRTVLEKDLASIGSGLGFIFKTLGFVAKTVGEAEQKIDQEKFDKMKDIKNFPSTSDPRHPDYPSAANPRWKL